MEKPRKPPQTARIRLRRRRPATRIRVVNTADVLIASAHAAIAISAAPFQPLTALQEALNSISNCLRGISLAREPEAQGARLLIEAFTALLGETLARKGHIIPQSELTRAHRMLVRLTIPALSFDLPDLLTHTPAGTPLVRALEPVTLNWLIRMRLAKLSAQGLQPTRTALSRDQAFAVNAEIRARFNSYFTYWAYHKRTEHPEFFDFWTSINRTHQNAQESLTAMTSYRKALRRLVREPLPIARDTQYSTGFSLGSMYVVPHARVANAETDYSLTPISGDAPIDRVAWALLERGETIIVHGGPGHGKTSFAQVLAATLAKTRPEIITLFVRFSDIPEHSSFADFLRTHVGQWATSKTLSRQRSVIILDGMDEAQIASGGKAFSSVFRSVLSFAKETNALDDSAWLTLVMTGRSTFVASYMSFFPSSVAFIEIRDFTLDQQVEWLDRLRQLDPLAPTLEHINERGFGAFTSQPVLLALVSFVCSETRDTTRKKASSTKTLSGVYRELVHWAYRRYWEDPNRPNALAARIRTRTEYLRTLSSLAFACFQIGRPHAQEEEVLAQLRSIPEAPLPTPSDLTHLLQNCRLSFFFEANEQRAFEFTHKSVQDFLVSSFFLRRIIAAARSSIPLLPLFVELFSRRRLDVGHTRFVTSALEEIDEQDRHLLFAGLRCAWERFSTHEAISLLTQQGNPRPLHSTGAIGISLLLVMLACHERTFRKGGPRMAFGPAPASKEGLRLVDAAEPGLLASSNPTFVGIDFSDLSFSQQSLRSTLWEECTFTRVDFRLTDIEGATFESCHLSDCDLQSSRHHEAVFKNCVFEDVSLDKPPSLAPRGMPSGATAFAGVAARAGDGTVRVLLVEDEATIRVTLAEDLSNYGFVVSQCEDGSEASRIIDIGDYDAMIVDVRLPGVSGMDLLRRSKSLRPHIPVLVISAYATIDNSVEAMQNGADDYIQKPFLNEQIIERLRQLPIVVQRSLDPSD